MFLNIKSQLPSGTKLIANWMGWFRGADGKSHAATGLSHRDYTGFLAE